MTRTFIALLVLTPLLAAAGVTATSEHPDAGRPVCGIAPWTGTCSCTPPGSHAAMSFADFAAQVARDPHGLQLLSEARVECGLAGI